jgi:hypothetical protein
LELADDVPWTELWIMQIPADLIASFSFESGLEQRPRDAAIPDLYFHCKKSDASIWQLSTGLAHFGTVPPASHH